MISSGGVNWGVRGATANGITVSNGGLLVTRVVPTVASRSRAVAEFISGANIQGLTLMTGATQLHAIVSSGVAS